MLLEEGADVNQTNEYVVEGLAEGGAVKCCVSCLLLQVWSGSYSQGSLPWPFVVFGVAAGSGRGRPKKRQVSAVDERDDVAACGGDAADGCD